MLKIPCQSNFSELLLLIHITSIFSNVSFQYKKSPGKQIFLLNRRFSVKAASGTWRASTCVYVIWKRRMPLVSMPQAALGAHQPGFGPLPDSSGSVSMPQAALGAHQHPRNFRIRNFPQGVSMPQAALGAHQQASSVEEVEQFSFNAASGTWRASTWMGLEFTYRILI